MSTNNTKNTGYELDPAYQVLILGKDKGGIFKFPVYISEKTDNLSLDVLDLSPRALNCLRRGRVSSVGELIAGINGSESLKKIRGLGGTTAAEIMMKLYLYQYASLDEKRKIPYLQKVIDMNGL